MTIHSNPFVRGYQNLRVRRTLMITYANDDFPAVFRPLHPAQGMLSDEAAQSSQCIFGSDFAVITDGQLVDDELRSACKNSGFVRLVIYAVTADDFGQPVHVGDTYSAELAQQVVRRLSLGNGNSGPCWEISSRHLSVLGQQSLMSMADTRTPPSLLFEAFRLPDRAIGCRLFSSPWTEAHLASEGLSKEHVRQQQRHVGLPEELIQLLHLAADASARILIFDTHNHVLTGLPVFQ